MMTDKRTRKQWMIAAVVLAVLVYSAAGIDYSGLAYFSPSMAGDVFRGLAKPAWKVPLIYFLLETAVYCRT